MKKVCLQENEGDCGYAALKNILIHYHRNNDFALLKEEYKENMSFLEIKDIGEKYNLELQGVLFEEKEKVYNNTYSICQMKINEKMHFIVFCYEKKGNVKIIDPQYGETTVKSEWFIEHFTGNALIYVEHQKIEFKRKCQMINPLFVILYISSLLIDYGLVYLLSFLMKNDNYLVLLLITVLGLTISIVGKALLIKASYIDCDKKYERIISSDIKMTREERKIILLAKQSIVNRVFSLINSIAILLFCIIILISNEILNIILLVLLSLLIVVPSIIKKMWFVDEEYILLLKEGSVINNIDNASEEFSLLNKMINKIITKRTIRLVILYVLSITFCFLTNYFNNYYSLTYIMFNSGIFIVFIDRLSSINKDYDKTNNEYNRMKSIFNRFLV